MHNSSPSAKLPGIRSYILLLFLVSIGGTVVLYLELPDYSNALETQRGLAGSIVLDRDGRVLRILPDRNGQFCHWEPVDAVPRRMRQAVIAAEDHRFAYHPGFDPIAVVRALYTNIRRGEIVSGASTITQQVVRLLHPRPRTYAAKFIELLCGIKMEWQLTKDQIMELHLNLSPLGGNLRGVGIASERYFGKPIGAITAGEAAALAVIPRSPCRYDPRPASGREALLHEKDRLLDQMKELGCISPEEAARNAGPSLRFVMEPLPVEAPHFVDYILARTRRFGGAVRTTLDLALQHDVEHIVRSHRSRLARMGVRQAGALVASVDPAEVMAMVGSLAYQPRDQGFNNATIARRSAGSTLKPFLYALALDSGMQPSSEIPDTFRTYPTPHGDYLPLNADRRLYGPVTLRIALGNSLNISAVKLLRELGVDNFYGLLTELGLVDRSSEPANHYGLGLAIGNLEVTLFQLVQAYRALAAHGRFRPITMVPRDDSPGLRVISPQAAFIVSDMLADPSARLLTFGNPASLDFGFPLSVKTGTSTGYRDCWIVGFTSRHVVGVWAGNFDGSPTRGATGSSACGPILNEIIRALYGSAPPARARPPQGVSAGEVCWMSGMMATSQCPYTGPEWFVGDPAGLASCPLEHGHDEFRYLGGQYARWVDRRRQQFGAGRYRLGSGVTRAGPHQPLFGGEALVRAPRYPGRPVSPIAIVRPHDGDRLVISPTGSNRVLFQAVVEPPSQYVVWMVDGIEVGRTGPPYEFVWNASRGDHVVHAVIPSFDAATVRLHVE
jgi:penicillin-binding protein 1C